MNEYRKKLIEVAIPLEAINRESAREKSIRHGHPSTLHLWWARRPLAACRAVLFASLVDDPSAHPDRFPTEEAQEKERQRLFRIIEELVKWENINNERVLEAARQEILKSTGGNPPAILDPFCGGGSIPLEAQRLGLKVYASDLNPVAVLITKAMIEIPPKFAGRAPVNPESRRTLFGRGEAIAAAAAGASSGRNKAEASFSTPETPAKSPHNSDDIELSDESDLERERLSSAVDSADQNLEREHSLSGVESAGQNLEREHSLSLVESAVQNLERESSSSVVDSAGQNLECESSLSLSDRELAPASYGNGARGLAEDVRYYGQWMRDEAERRIGHLYPKVRITEEILAERSDLRKQGLKTGDELTVIAWLWARTVKCPNPACGAQMPLVRSFDLSKRKGKRAWVEPRIPENGAGIEFLVKAGSGRPRAGSVRRSGATCLCCATPIAFEYIRQEGKAERIEQQLMAIVCESNSGRAYFPPIAIHEGVAKKSFPDWSPQEELQGKCRVNVSLYGLDVYADLFTPRQLVALTTFSDLVGEARQKVLADARKAGWKDDGEPLEKGGTGATAYADAVATYLAFALDKAADYWSAVCSWHNSGEKMRNTFGRQAIPMVWDFAECCPFSNSSGNWMACVDWIWKVLDRLPLARELGKVNQADATHLPSLPDRVVVATDPPYYDNIGYADLSDFFYVWLRRSLSQYYPELFATLLTPKSSELVATPYRFKNSKQRAKDFFEKGLRDALKRIYETQSQAYPLTLFYAFKQAETSSSDGQTASTGWETMLEGLIQSGFQITGTWPMRTELSNRSVASGTNALASSILLVCFPRQEDAPLATRRDFRSQLSIELPKAIAELQKENIAPVDLAQSAIGPGMAVFSRYSRVIEADGTPMPVRTALGLINQALDEFLSEQESEFDAHTRWALAWYQQYGMEPGDYGQAEVLATAKAVAISGLVQDGILQSSRSKVRLLRREEYDGDWDPLKDKRLPIWELTQRIIKAQREKGEEAAAEIVDKVGGMAETARDLAYRLYGICERKNWAQEAVAYNGLVVAWPEILRLAGKRSVPTTAELFQD